MLHCRTAAYLTSRPARTVLAANIRWAGGMVLSTINRRCPLALGIDAIAGIATRVVATAMAARITWVASAAARPCKCTTVGRDLTAQVVAPVVVLVVASASTGLAASFACFSDSECRHIMGVYLIPALGYCFSKPCCFILYYFLCFLRSSLVTAVGKTVPLAGLVLDLLEPFFEVIYV